MRMRRTILAIFCLLISATAWSEDILADLDQVSFIEDNPRLISAATFVSNVHARLADCRAHYQETKEALTESTKRSAEWESQIARHFSGEIPQRIHDRLIAKAQQKVADTRGSSIYTSAYCLRLHQRILTTPLPTEIQAYLTAPVIE